MAGRDSKQDKKLFPKGRPTAKKSAPEQNDSDTPLVNLLSTDAASARPKAISTSRFSQKIHADGFSFTHPLDGPIAKDDAVQSAVTMGLRLFHKWPPDDPAVTMNGLPNILNPHTLKMMLDCIAASLATSQPPLIFKFNDNDVDKALPMNVEALTEMVYEKTT